MSFRFGLMAAAGAFLAAASPAHAGFDFSFSSTDAGAALPLAIALGGNTLTFTDTVDAAGTFTVANAKLYSNFGYAIGDYASFGGDTLTMTFAAPVTGLGIQFGLEDIGGALGNDFLTVMTNTGYTTTLNAGLTGSGLNFPESTDVFYAGAPFTSVTFTSPNAFAIATVASAPEPATLAVLGAGLVGLAGFRRRR